MRRPVLYAILSLLLLVTQGQVLVHPFAHLESRVARPDRVEAAFRTPLPPAPSARCWRPGPTRFIALPPRRNSPTRPSEAR